MLLKVAKAYTLSRTRTPVNLRMNIPLRSSFFLLALCGALAACNPVENVRKRERYTQLETVTNTYRKLMRWGHYDQAAQYLKARDGTQQAPDFESMSHYKVSSFSVADQIVADTGEDAKVTAYIEFYNVDTGVTSSVTDIQLWWFDPESKRWFLGTKMVNFADFE